MSLSAYRRTLGQTETPRQIERRIMLRITADLSAHADRFDGTTNRAERLGLLAAGLRDALSDNLRLWSALKADLISPGNALPRDLRGSLVNLAAFVERHTGLVLGGDGKVAALVDVNRPVIAALTGTATGEG
ncbi:flagellar biosynthesis regulator FlaF [Tabrizicola sp.]|uniref:flagellar biosynthesis regulator FlaF n=1 Tax=Tabrizicola sp. TaxID=2005166 RepID=UPI0035B0DC61